jgi:hypothetical protein
VPSGGEQGQHAIVAALRDRRTYGEGRDEVVHLQTHISHVFLVGDFAYKLKKAVRFPFLDFGTLAAREHFCREEVRLNRRLAAPIYLAVVPVARDADRVSLGGDGEVVDWVVKMRRLPSPRNLAALVEAGAVPAGAAERIAGVLAAFHAAAPVAAGGTPEALEAAWSDNLAGVRPMVGSLLAPEDYEMFDDFGRTFVVRHDAVLRARPALGHVRDGHGDLRADHVYLLDDPLPAIEGAGPVPAGVHVVDCIEFAPAFRAVDVAADISFLAMELAAVGRADLADDVVRAYADASGDEVVAALVPYHACHRAIVRGKVDGLLAGEPEVHADVRRTAADRARALFALGCRYAWSSGEPVVVACTGLSGTGKSAVAAAIGAATGWRVVSSDVVRKAAGVLAERRYEPEAVAAVYAALRRAVEETLGARASIVVDATFLTRGERDRLARTCDGFGARHLFVDCVADETTVRRRLEARSADSVSEARWDVHARQARTREPLTDDEPRLPLDTSGSVQTVRPELVRRLWRWRQGRSAA